MVTKRYLRNLAVWLWAAVFIVDLIPGAADFANGGVLPSAAFKSASLQSAPDLLDDLSFASPEPGDDAHVDSVAQGFRDSRPVWQAHPSEAVALPSLSRLTTGPPTA